MKTELSFAQRVLVFTVAIFFIFFAIGKIVFDKRPPIEGRVDYFLSSLDNPKLPYYLNLNALHQRHNNLIIEIVNSTSTIRKACYQIMPDRLVGTTECGNDLKIVLDEHAASSIISASYYPLNTLFSELMFGHVKLSGFTLGDIAVMIR
jgi:hypothetical protein